MRGGGSSERAAGWKRWTLPAALGGALALSSGCAAVSAETEAEIEEDIDGEDAGESAEALRARGGYVGKYNRGGQGHADVCVKLKHGEAELRYADFSPTGYKLRNEQLDLTSSGRCPDGYVQLDAREMLKTPKGRLVFHRGGYGYYNGTNVKYGHLWIADLDRHVEVEKTPVGNGKACKRTRRYRARVAPLPAEMHFCKTKGKCSTPELTNGYSSYGDPAQQGSLADPNIHYTYLVWSWVNVAGGGVVRTLIEDGDRFDRCGSVPSIRLATVTDHGKKNGWVRAVYGGTKQAGKWIYGWTVHSHRFEKEKVVYHLERAE